MAQSATFQDGVQGAGTFKDGGLSSVATISGTKVSTLVGLVQAMVDKKQRGVILMTLSEVPSTAIVTSGILTLNVSVAASGAGLSYEVIRGTETDWTESSSFPTWTAKDGSNNWGTAGGSPTGGLGTGTAMGAMPTSTGDVDLDITELVRDAVENRSGVLNILIRSTVESGSTYDSFTYKSGDNSTTGDRPSLTVKYVEGGGSAGKLRATTMRAGGRRSMAKRNRRLFRR